MTSEQQFLIQVLRDFIKKQKTTVIPVDIDILASYGKKHEVLAILYYQMKMPQFLSSYSSTLYANANRMKLVQQLTDKFCFPYFIIKGSSVSALYPVPALRTMGDIDLVVRTEDREQAHELFISQGYQNESKFSDREWIYYKNGMEFELHDHLIYSESVNNSKQEMFFNNFWPYVSDNKLDNNFHFLFLISHLRKHFMNEGVGVRQFMDIAIMSQYADLNWSWIEQKADEIELLSFMKTVLAFNTRWFDVHTPIKTKMLDDDFFEEATAKIIADGVFGFGNEQNADSKAANLYRKNGNVGMLKNAIGILFPSYRNLITMPQYGWLKGKAYLLPFAWIYRFVKGRKKRKNAFSSLKKSFASMDQIQKRELMYKQWGL